MRSKNINIAVAVHAADLFTQDLERIFDELIRCKDELCAAEEELDRELQKLHIEREALRSDR